MDSNDINETNKARVTLMNEQVVPYKVYIRKLVETATVSETNRWNTLRGDAIGVFKGIPVIRRRRFLPWLVLWVLGIAAIYYFLTPLLGVSG